MKMNIKKMQTKYSGFEYCNWCGKKPTKEYCYVQYGTTLYKDQALMMWCLKCYLRFKEGKL